MVKPLFDKGAAPRTPKQGVLGERRSPIPIEVLVVLEKMSSEDNVRVTPYISAHFAGKIDLNKVCDEGIDDWKRYDRNVNELSVKLSGLPVKEAIEQHLRLVQWRKRLSFLMWIPAIKNKMDAAISGWRFGVQAGTAEVASIKKQIETLRSMVERLSKTMRDLSTTLEVLFKSGKSNRDLSDRMRYCDHCHTSLELTKQQIKAVEESIESVERMQRGVQVYM